MKRSIAMILVVLASCGWAGASEPVYIPDLNLKAAIEQELGILDPTPEDMLGMDQLDASLRRIVDITGLEYAKNLWYLDLSRNNDHGGGIWWIDALAGLKHLEHLDLNNNYISDLSPIASCKDLRYLDIHDNKISDISVLGPMVHLETAYLYRNRISDISVLAGLKKLRVLQLHDNQITDLSPLLGLTDLQELTLLQNPLSDHACVVQIPQIMANNPGISILYSPCGPPKLLLSSTAGGSVVEPGEGAFTYPYESQVVLRAQPDPGFVFLAWTGTYNAYSNPVMVTMDQEHQVRAHFISLSHTLYVDANAPNDPKPGDPSASDPLEDGSSLHPFDSIREAVEVAAEGAKIVIRPGLYLEDIMLEKKSLHICGASPNAPDPAAYPVLGGSGVGPVVRLSDSNSVLSGLAVHSPRELSSAVVSCQGGRPSIRHCLIVGNRVSGHSGSVIRCQQSDVQFHHCTIADNQAGQSGGCLYLVDSLVKVSHCILWGNVPAQIVFQGLPPVVEYTDISGGWQGTGNLDLDPVFARPGLWIPGQDGPVAYQVGDYHLRSAGGRWDPAEGMWIHDQISSPCIDAGDPGLGVGFEPQPNGGRVNIGAYGGTTQASRSAAIEIY